MINDGLPLNRRVLLISTLGYVLNNQVAMSATNLMTCPIEMLGGWDNLIGPSKAVIEKVRRACLGRVMHWVEVQPSKIVLENHVSEYPSIWLHQEPRTAAWIRLNAGPGAWCQLAYQFGHELGHVLANSWTFNASPRTPSQWIEESLAEALSIYGLRQLAKDWRKDPPFPGDEAYSQEIEKYVNNILISYEDLGKKAGVDNTKNWYLKEEDHLEHDNGLGTREKAFSNLIFRALQRDPLLIADYGALNRWPERTAVGNKEYIKKWQESCKNLGLYGKLAGHIEGLLFVK